MKNDNLIFVTRKVDIDNKKNKIDDKNNNKDDVNHIA
jgi:hypothetical protein